MRTEAQKYEFHPGKEMDRQLTYLGVHGDRIFLNDQFEIFEVNASNLGLINSVQICSSSCNGNNLVLLNRVNDTIIVCADGNHKFCSVRNTSNFSSNETSSSLTVTISSKASRPTVGVVTSDGAMFVAVTYGPGVKVDRYGGQTYFHETYKFVISKLMLNEGILNRDKALPFRLPENVSLNDYLIFFKGAVEHKKHVLFATNQKFKVGENQTYISKMISLCKNDRYFYSYTDMKFECKHGAKIYNLVQDIQVFKSGSALRNIFKFNITTNEDMIAAVFAFGDDPDNPKRASAVCFYSLEEIQRKRREARERFIICPGSSLTEEERYLKNHVQGGCLNESHFGVKLFSLFNCQLH